MNIGYPEAVMAQLGFIIDNIPDSSDSNLEHCYIRWYTDGLFSDVVFRKLNMSDSEFHHLIIKTGLRISAAEGTVSYCCDFQTDNERSVQAVIDLITPRGANFAILSSDDCFFGGVVIQSVDFRRFLQDDSSYFVVGPYLTQDEVCAAMVERLQQMHYNREFV